MEVHHHPEVEKKGLKEYLAEGLMIFVAVMMGFIAENIRETIGERSREKEYMESYSQDLKADSTNINIIISVKKQDIVYYDSLFYIFRNNIYKKETINAYYYVRKLGRQNFFYEADGTIKQLENAGGLRLIQKKNLIDSIQSYGYAYNTVKDLEKYEQDILNQVRLHLSGIFDSYVFDEMIKGNSIVRPDKNYPLLPFTKEDLNELHLLLHILKRVKTSEIENMETLKEHGKNLLTELTLNYHLNEK